MYCRNCGKEINGDAVFCQYCGCKVVLTDNNLGAEITWKVFARISKIVGIVSILISIYVLGLTAVPGLIFGIIALKTKNEDVKGEARAGIVLNIIASALGSLVIMYIIIVIVSVAIDART